MCRRKERSEFDSPPPPLLPLFFFCSFFSLRHVPLFVPLFSLVLVSSRPKDPSFELPSLFSFPLGVHCITIIAFFWVHPLGISCKGNTSFSLLQHQQHQLTNKTNTNANAARWVSNAVVEPYNDELVAERADNFTNATLAHSRERSPVMPHFAPVER